MGFADYLSLRKHCEQLHREKKSDTRTPVKHGLKKRPCRFFKNGDGQCSPPSGHCEYDHTVVPEGEREHCFHKQACVYKPNCIFYHPEGQGEEVWQQNKNKSAKICKYAEKGVTCMRNICSFYHPAVRNNLGFHWGHYRQPPSDTHRIEQMTSTKNIPKLSVRIPVIVANRMQSRVEIPDLSMSMEGLALD